MKSLWEGVFIPLTVKPGMGTSLGMSIEEAKSLKISEAKICLDWIGEQWEKEEKESKG